MPPLGPKLPIQSSSSYVFNAYGICLISFSNDMLYYAYIYLFGDYVTVESYEEIGAFDDYESESATNSR